MKFQVEANELKRAIAFLSPIVNVNSSNIGMRHVLLREKDGKIEIKGFSEHSNGSYFMTVSDIDGSVEAYVLAKTLFSVCKSLSGTIKVNVGKQLSLSCGRSRYTIATLDEDTFKTTNVSQLEYYDIFFPTSINLKSLQTRLNSVMHCLSDDNSKMELQNVLIKQSEDKVLMMACNGVYGSVVECPEEYQALDGYMLYKDLVDSIMQISNANTISVLQSDNIIYIKTHNFISASALTESEFPFENIYSIYKGVTEEGDLNVCLDPEPTKDALNRLLYLADPSTSGIKAQFSEGKLSFSVEENNSGYEEVPILDNSKVDKDFIIYVDGKKIKESLSKSVGQVYWRAQNPEEIQYICDGDSVQFFLGLSE